MGANNSKESVSSNGNQGTIVNNFYANSYYASIDASASSVGGDTPAENGTVSGILGSFASAFTSAALLAKPKVENTTNMEDRVITLKAGNTLVNSQASEGVLHGYGCETNVQRPSSCGDDPTVTTHCIERGFTIPLTDWTNTKDSWQALVYRLSDHLKDDTIGNMFSKTLGTHSFTKCGYRVSLQINTSPFHSGLIGLFLVPECCIPASMNMDWIDLKTQLPLLTSSSHYQGTGLNSTQGNFSNDCCIDSAGTIPQQLFIYPHQLINPKDTNIGTVEVPYVNCAPTSDPQIHNIWTALIVVLAPLQFSPGASPNVSMTMTVTPVGAVFNGLRHPVAQAQTAIPVRQMQNSGQFSTTFPARIEPCYGLTPNPTRDFLPPVVKDLVSIAKVPCFLLVGTITNQNPFFTVSNTFTSANPLFEMNVILSDFALQRTFVSMFGKFFCNYRGSLQITAIAATTAMTRGKLLFSYTPPGAGKPTNLKQAMMGTYTIWDLGLQSTLNFTIPYISSVDFRINSRSVASALNADGWLTIWILNPITYPPQTPPNQAILLMASAGSDFSYRLPISPPFVQNGVHDNAEKGVTETTDATQFCGESVGYTTNHSDCSFFFDRYRCVGMIDSVKVNSRNIISVFDTNNKVKKIADMFKDTNPKHFLTLSPNPAISTTPVSAYIVIEHMSGSTKQQVLVTSGDPFFLRSCPFTYFHCDLEVTVKPIGGVDGNWYVTWFPPGSELKENQIVPSFYTTGESGSMSLNVNNNDKSLFYSLFPTFHSRGTECVSFNIPYTSPLSVIPTRFDGYPDYSRTVGAYGTGPANHFGTLTVTSNNEGYKFTVFVRYKNFKGYVPKTLPPLPLFNKDSRSVTNENISIRPLIREKSNVSRLKLLLSGDIETNPGPMCSKFQVQGSMSDFLNVARKPETLDNVTRLLTTLNNLMNKWNNVKHMCCDSYFLRDILCLLVKLTSLSYLVAGQGPSAYLAASAVLIADGISFLDWYEKIKRFLGTRFRVPPPVFTLAQGPDLRDLVTFFNAARGAQWMVDSIRGLITWIKQWLELEEENEAVHFERLLIESPKHCKAINDYNVGKTFVRPENSFDFMEKLVESATKLGKVNIAGYFRTFTSVDTDAPRMEPVVLVLRGKPGAGKSAAATIITAAVSKILTGTQSVYTLSPDTEHMDGYHGQFSMIMDDLGQNPDGEDFRTFCQMISVAQYRPSMADLKDKGILFKSQFIVATTNLPEFRPLTVSDRGAVDRRITFDIGVTPGSAVTKNGKLDLAAALKPDGEGEFPYSTDCQILHTTGLLLQNLRTGKTMNIKELVDLIVKKIKSKRTTSGMLEGLVVQSPKIVGYTKDDEGVVIVDCLEDWHRIRDKKRKQQALEMVAEEMKIQHEKHTNTISLIKQFLSGLGVVAAVGAALAAGKALRNIMTSDRATDEPDSKPEENKEENKNAEGPYNGPTKKELKTLKLKAQGPLLDLEKKVLANVQPFILRVAGRDYIQSCLFIGKRVFLVNKHAIDSVDKTFRVAGKVYNLDDVDVAILDTEYGLTDVAAVKLSTGPEWKNLSKLFVSLDTTLHPGTRITILSNDQLNMVREGSFLRNEDDIPTNIGPIPFVMLYKASSYFGMCGSAVLTRFGDCPGILGLHCAGGGGVCVASRVTKRMVETVLDYFYPPQVQGQIVNTENGPRVHVPRQSKLKRTNAIYPATSKYGPAVLSKNDSRLNPDVDFDKVIFSKHVANVVIDEDTSFWNALKMSAQIYAEKLKGVDFSPLTVEEAICGIPGLDRMDPNTASGLPYTKTRRQMIDFQEGKILDPELQARLNMWLSGKQPETLYQTFLKDEIRPIEKVKAGKTRIIDVTPLDHVLAFRIVLGRFMAHFHNNYGFDLGSAVGCDPDVAWANFGFALSSKKYQYDFDYSNFDASHSESIFELLKQFVFTKDNGFDHRCSLMIDSLVTSTHCYEEQRMTIRGGLPSGTSGTSVINTIINNIIFKAALYHTYSNFEWDDVQMLAYGDDIVAASDCLLDLDKVKEFMAYIGYKITPADKGEKFIPKSMQNIQFLKRSFRKVAGVWAPIMDLENLQAMLSWYKPGTLQEKLDSVARLAHFCGEKEYDELFGTFVKDGFQIKPWKQLHFEWLNRFTE
ncbi:polyprotein [Human cosavirus]|uniref:polyprotein n=1 Tax=Human cosavirus TaxID=1233383 RepID=UPI00043FFBD5|nr:polyprotein [Human cosavirus]AHV83701.1 polyprotein [Human cosavirus]